MYNLCPPFKRSNCNVAVSFGSKAVWIRLLEIASSAPVSSWRCDYLVIWSSNCLPLNPPKQRVKWYSFCSLLPWFSHVLEPCGKDSPVFCGEKSGMEPARSAERPFFARVRSSPVPVNRLPVEQTWRHGGESPFLKEKMFGMLEPEAFWWRNILWKVAVFLNKKNESGVCFQIEETTCDEKTLPISSCQVPKNKDPLGNPGCSPWILRLNSQIHPWRLTWNIIIEVWKVIFLSKWVICRFHVNLQGCNAGVLCNWTETSEAFCWQFHCNHVKFSASLAELIFSKEAKFGYHQFGMNDSKVKAYDFCLWFRLSKFGNCPQAAHFFWTYSLALLETPAPRLRGCLKLFLENRPWVHAKRGVKWKTGCEIRKLKVIFRLKNDMRMGFYLEKTAKSGSRFKGEPWPLIGMKLGHWIFFMTFQTFPWFGGPMFEQSTIMF